MLYLNPLQHYLFEIGESLLKKTSESPSEDAWIVRNCVAWKALTAAFCWLRDSEGVPITIESMVAGCKFEKLVDVHQKGLTSPVYPAELIDVKKYFEDFLPGSGADGIFTDRHVAEEHHGYCTMNVLSSVLGRNGLESYIVGIV